MSIAFLVAAGLAAAVADGNFLNRSSAEDALVGVPSVIDGDTLDLRGTRIRLHGIDAPESRQLCHVSGRAVRCGQKAALALDELIGRRTIRCEQKDKDRYGRIVAVCKLGGTDINGWMVAQGHALAYRSYSKDYVTEEMEAQRARRGVWAGSFDYPWDWRKGKRLPLTETPPVQTVTAGDCPIKGNITAKGEKVYHTPASPWYERVTINTAKGERWFCTEQEAKAAGWRAAQY